MINLTKKGPKLQHLEACLDHWKWLAETGSSTKYNYFTADKKHPANYCYVCEYVKEYIGTPIISHCDKCPLEGYAWKYSNVPSNPNICPCENDPNSLYLPWSLEREKNSPDPRILSYHAQNMVDAIIFAIKMEA